MSDSNYQLFYDSGTIQGISGLQQAIQNSQTEINGDIDLQGLYKVENSVDPLNPQDLVTLSYANSHYTGGSGVTNQIISTDTTSSITAENGNSIDITVNSESIATIFDNGGIQINSGQFNFQTEGDNTNSNNFTLNGQRAVQTGGYNSTSLNLLQKNYTGENCLASIDMGLDDGSGSSINFGAGLLPSNPAGLQNVAYIQDLSGNGDAMAFATGQALMGNTMVLYNDIHSGTIPQQTQFNRKTGYITSSTPSITEPTQFPTKAYVDAAVSGLSTSTITSADSTRTVQAQNTQILVTGGPLNLNNLKITNLPTGNTGAQDSINYTDLQNGLNTKYTNTTNLNGILPPTSFLNMNFQTVSNLSPGIVPNDAVTISQLGNYYQNTVPLNSITAPTGSLSLNSQKITNLAAPTSSTDGLNLGTADSRYYQNTTSLDQIVPASNNISLNSNRITSLSNAINPSDAVNLSQLSSLPFPSFLQGYSTTIMTTGAIASWTNLKQIGTKITLSSTQITLAANTTYQIATNAQITEPTLVGSLTNINWQLTSTSANLVNAFSSTLQLIIELAGSNNGSCNFLYTTSGSPQSIQLKCISSSGTITGTQSAFVISEISTSSPVSSTTQILSIGGSASLSAIDTGVLQAIGNIQFPSGTAFISGLANPTLSSQAANKAYVDLTTGIGTNTLNSIATTNLTSASVNLNSHNLINVLDPTTAQMAATKNYVDTTTLPSTSTLNTIQTSHPNTAALNMNGFKISNGLPGTLSTDFATVSQLGGLGTNTLATIASTNASTSSITASTQKIINLGNATTGTDALNQNTGDARYLPITQQLGAQSVANSTTTSVYLGLSSRLYGGIMSDTIFSSTAVPTTGSIIPLTSIFQLGNSSTITLSSPNITLAGLQKYTITLIANCQQTSGNVGVLTLQVQNTSGPTVLPTYKSSLGQIKIYIPSVLLTSQIGSASTTFKYVTPSTQSIQIACITSTNLLNCDISLIVETDVWAT